MLPPASGHSSLNPRLPQLAPNTSNTDVSPLDEGSHCCPQVAPPVPQATITQWDRHRGPL